MIGPFPIGTQGACVAALLMAPFIGSFLGVLILRLPAGRSVVWSRSRCDTCGAPVQPWDLVPIVSFLMLRGRCRDCGGRIGRMHLAIEVASLLIPLWAQTVETDIGWFWADCLLGWTLLALAWTDVHDLILPDALTLPLTLAGLATTYTLERSATFDHALGACLGYLSFRVIEILYRRLRKRDGLGQGDAKLMAAAGAWVGWALLPLLVVGAAVGGIVLALVSAHRRSASASEILIPFGASIACSLWLVRLYLT